MILTVLGCGTSTGVPLIHCKCSVCRSKNPKNKRLRASAWLQVNGKHFLFDTSTDLRQQAIRAKIPRVDAVLYTHPHADHTHGIDELRSFNFIQKSVIPAYGNQWTYDDLKSKFPYIFQEQPTEGGGIPQLSLHLIHTEVESFDVLGIKVTPLSLLHGSRECGGYRIGSLAYITDCSKIPSHTLARLQNLDVLVLDCLRNNPHPTHFHLDQALSTISELKPKRTVLTHLSHEFDYIKSSKRLPKKVSFAYDGLVIKVRPERDNL